ncbi:alpha/beta fold hydrolase [Litorivivens sp.]|uniref:alpha/beta fold hydrolase n=1 Tax=Litorivivens sp. TaxID=2020868 RepID=UPI0035655037
MNPLAKRLLDQGLATNQRVAQAAGNGFDWLFRRNNLVKSGHTWFELVYDGDPMAVRYYGLPDEDEIELADGSTMPIRREQFKRPLVLVPPLGVTTETFDLLPHRSLVKYMAACGFKTYLIDWGKPKKKHAHLGLEDYAETMMGEALAEIRRHSGCKEISLMGWCMGGLISLLYMGLTKDPQVKNLVTVASPIDLRGGGLATGVAQALNVPAQMIRRYTDFRLHVLDPSVLSAPPWLTTLAFKLTDPLSSVTSYWDLITRLWDREFVESHTTTSDYLNNMLLYPGGVVQDMAVKVAVDNKLATGEIEIGSKLAELNKIQCSLLVFAGETDSLVPPSIAERIMDVVASSDKAFYVSPGGHMGVTLGSRAQQAVWAQAADWLQARDSGRKPRKSAAGKSRVANTSANSPGKPPSGKAKVAPAKKQRARKVKNIKST